MDNGRRIWERTHEQVHSATYCPQYKCTSVSPGFPNTTLSFIKHPRRPGQMGRWLVGDELFHSDALASWLASFTTIIPCLDTLHTQPRPRPIVHHEALVHLQSLSLSHKDVTAPAPTCTCPPHCPSDPDCAESLHQNPSSAKALLAQTRDIDHFQLPIPATFRTLRVCRSRGH